MQIRRTWEVEKCACWLWRCFNCDHYFHYCSEREERRGVESTFGLFDWVAFDSEVFWVSTHTSWVRFTLKLGVDLSNYEYMRLRLEVPVLKLERGKGFDFSSSSLLRYVTKTHAHTWPSPYLEVIYMPINAKRMKSGNTTRQRI